MDSKLFEKAAHFCAYQERTHEEVRKKMKSLSIDDDDIEEIIATLINENFLNEERFAKVYSGGKFRLKNWGRNKITWELKRKGLSNFCIQSGLKEIEEDDYHAKVLSLIEKKISSYSNDLDPFIQKKKISEYLIRKGFEPHIVWEHLSQFFS